jgi:ribosomal protein L7/L12
MKSKKQHPSESQKINQIVWLNPRKEEQMEKVDNEPLIFGEGVFAKMNEPHYDVFVTKVIGDKTAVIKAIKEITGFSLQKIKSMVNGYPQVIDMTPIAIDTSITKASTIKNKLEVAGAEVEIRRTCVGAAQRRPNPYEKAKTESQPSFEEETIKAKLEMAVAEEDYIAGFKQPSFEEEEEDAVASIVVGKQYLVEVYKSEIGTPKITISKKNCEHNVEISILDANDRLGVVLN